MIEDVSFNAAGNSTLLYKYYFLNFLKISTGTFDTVYIEVNIQPIGGVVEVASKK